MRIVVFSRALPGHGPGGMEQVAWQLAQAWGAGGHQVCICTTPGGTPRSVPDGVTVVELPGASRRYSREWFEATRRVDLSSFDVVLGVSAGAREVARKGAGGRPVVLQLHGTSVTEIAAKLRLATPRALAGLVLNVAGLVHEVRDYPRYSAVVSVGEGVSATLARYPRWASPRRLVTIPNGVPSSHGPAVPRDGDFAYVGRLHREKGVDSLLRVLPEMDGRLDIIGDGPDRARLERLAGRAGLTDRVRFHGAVPASEARRRMRRFAVVVVPSRRREVGLPLVALEALDAGAAVVVSPEIRASAGGVLPPGVTAYTGARDMATVLDEARARRGEIGLPPTRTLETVAQSYLDLFARLADGVR